MRTWGHWLAAAAFFAATPALAHTSYLKPNVFSAGPGVERVSIEAAFTENFPQPDGPVESQDFHLYQPDARRDVYDNIAVLSQMTVLENDLTEPGTYLFSSGERLGRTGLQGLIDGQWRPLDPDEPPPPGVRTRQTQTATVANVYVTKGATSNGVLGVHVGTLEIMPLTHPSAICMDDGFRVRVLMSGRALANQEINLDRDGGAYDATPFHQVLRTDAAGEALIHFDRPGIYLAMVRASGDAPAGAATPIRSYTTSLTFEVSR